MCGRSWWLVVLRLQEEHLRAANLEAGKERQAILMCNPTTYTD
jgi:hypothetical protein